MSNEIIKNFTFIFLFKCQTYIVKLRLNNQKILSINYTNDSIKSNYEII